MNEINSLQIAFAVFSILSVVLLILLFIARIWKPALEKRFGWLTYAMSIPALIIAVLVLIKGGTWYYWLPLIMYGIWSVFGSVVDIWKPVEWRNPKYLPIFIPYVVFFIISMTGLWVPLWFIKPALWITFAILYSILCTFVVLSHKRESNSHRLNQEF